MMQRSAALKVTIPIFSICLVLLSIGGVHAIKCYESSEVLVDVKAKNFNSTDYKKSCDQGVRHCLAMNRTNGFVEFHCDEAGKCQGEDGAIKPQGTQAAFCCSQHDYCNSLHKLRMMSRNVALRCYVGRADKVAEEACFSLTCGCAWRGPADVLKTHTGIDEGSYFCDGQSSRSVCELAHVENTCKLFENTTLCCCEDSLCNSASNVQLLLPKQAEPVKDPVITEVKHSRTRTVIVVILAVITSVGLMLLTVFGYKRYRDSRHRGPRSEYSYSALTAAIVDDSEDDETIGP